MNRVRAILRRYPYTTSLGFGMVYGAIAGGLAARAGWPHAAVFGCALCLGVILGAGWIAKWGSR